MILEFMCCAQQELNKDDFNRVISLLKNGGLCILPSDSSYILTGLMTNKGISRDINLLLERQDKPMSLSFGSLKQVTEYIDFRNQAYNLFKELTPGGLTFVAPPNKTKLENISKNCLNADGTVGVRLSESLIESQIAGYFPVPSTPIRNSNGIETSSAREAWEIVEQRSKSLVNFRKIALVDSSVKHPCKLSTVVKEEMMNGFWYIRILREGIIPSDLIEKVAIEYKYKGIL